MSREFSVRLDRVVSPRWKVQEVSADISAGRLSRTKGPLTVSKAGRGRWFVMDGNHRALEGFMAGMKTYPAVVNEHVPDMTRAGGAYDSMLAEAVPITSRSNPFPDWAYVPSNDELGWVGSDKQIAWAKSIRTRKLPQILAEYDRIHDLALDTHAKATTYQSSIHTRRSAQHGTAAMAKTQTFLTEAPFIVDVRFWIDVRDMAAAAIINRYAEKLNQLNVDRYISRFKKNPPLGNTGWEFKQSAARRMLVEAVDLEGGNVGVVDDLIDHAFAFAKLNWQKVNNRILPAKDWPALRHSATLEAARILAAGELRRNPAVEPKRLVLPRGAKTFKLLSAFAHVYVVDGAAVRSRCVDFIGGSHHAVNAFVPKNEIWIERGVRSDGKYILAHEMLEKLLMDILGRTYNPAHMASNDMEADLRALPGDDCTTAWEEKAAAVIARHLALHFKNGDPAQQAKLATAMAGSIRRF